MATTGDGDAGMGRAAPRTQWSDLPDEILETVCSKLASPLGRVRFAAVCRSCRAAASRDPTPPALPLLLLSPRDWGTSEKRLYCPEDAGVLSVAFPPCLRNTWFNGSYDGGWIAAGRVFKTHVVVANLFPGAEVPLSEKQRTISCARHRRGQPYLVWKTIFSEAPTSGACILAAITDQCNLALCRIGCPDGGWTLQQCGAEELQDVAFCRGVLYGLGRLTETLFRYDIGENEDGAPVIAAAHKLNVQVRHGPRWRSRCFDAGYTSYIFELRGNLAMAVMINWSQDRQPFFKVFELAGADDADDKPHDYKWMEVKSLGDHALFLGQASSKAVQVPAGGHGGVKRNHIYYSNHRCLSINTDKKFDGEAYLTRSVGGDPMYCSCREDQEDARDDEEHHIPSSGYYVVGGPYPPIWCLPPAF